MYRIIFKSSLWIGLIAISLKLLTYHYRIIINFFPNEYREGAILVVTDLMTKGGNPYDLKNQPEYTNVYGIFYHIIVLPFAHLFGTNLPVHRAVGAVFIWLSCFVFYKALRWKKVSLLLTFSSTLILYGHLLYFTTPLARPDGLGFFLFLYSLIIPWRFQYSFKSLLINIVLGTLGFLTKPYFVLSILYLNLYLLIFRAKKQWLLHSLLSLSMLSLTILIIDRYYETYLNNTFWVNANVAGRSFGYAMRQLFEYTKINLGLVLVFAFCLLCSLLYSLVRLSKTKLDTIFNLINILDIGKPLLACDVDLMPFCLVISLILFINKFGQHLGARLTYIHHLITPFLIFSIFELLKKNIRFCDPIIKFGLIGLFSLNLWSISSDEVLPLPDLKVKEWNTIKALVSQHQHIFNSPAIVSILVEQNKKVYDSGQTEYFVEGIREQPFWDIFIPHKKKKIKDRYEQFIQEVNQSVESQDYDLIVLTEKSSRFISHAVLEKYYQYQESIIAPMSATLKRNWILEIWKPKQSQESNDA